MGTGGKSKIKLHCLEPNGMVALTTLPKTAQIGPPETLVEFLMPNVRFLVSLPHGMGYF